MTFEVLKWRWGEGRWKRRVADEEALQRPSRMLGTRGEIRRGREKDRGWGVAVWKNKGEMDRTEGRGKSGNQPTGKPFGHCLRSVADSPLLVGCDRDSLHRNLRHRRCTCLLTFTTTSSSLVLSLHHSHTHSSNSAVWCLSAFSMCWVELSDFRRLVKCNHSFLPYSSITAHTNGMPTVQKKNKNRPTVVSVCLLVCVDGLSLPCIMLIWIDKWLEQWIWTLVQRTLMCEGSCLCFSPCVWPCVRVCSCFPGDQQFISLLQWRFFFSLQITRKVEMGLSRQPQIRAERSLQLIAVTLSCEGCIFLSHWHLDLFFGDDLLQPV